MYALCVSGHVNTQGFVWTFLILIFYTLYIHFHFFVHSDKQWHVSDVPGQSNFTQSVCNTNVNTTAIADSIVNV